MSRREAEPHHETGPCMIREPAVAGRFYPGQADALEQQVAASMGPTTAARTASVLIGPHAGYVYSGSILGRTYARTVVPPRVILMGPNHTGRGAVRSLWSGGGWRLPTGTVPIDDALVDDLREHCGATPDLAAHHDEHAIEVHLPFVVARRPDVRIAALCLGRLSMAACRALGEGLAAVVARSPSPVLVVASTDMSHYVSAARASVLDHMALDRVTALDPAGLHRTVAEHGISMCGVIPTTVALFAGLALGATEAELVAYGHSGETSGDHARVVGYAGLLVH